MSRSGTLNFRRLPCPSVTEPSIFTLCGVTTALPVPLTEPANVTEYAPFKRGGGAPGPHHAVALAQSSNAAAHVIASASRVSRSWIDRRFTLITFRLRGARHHCR